MINLQTRQQIKDDFKANLSVEEIITKYQIAYSTLARILEEGNLGTPRRARRKGQIMNLIKGFICPNCKQYNIKEIAYKTGLEYHTVRNYIIRDINKEAK